MKDELFADLLASAEEMGHDANLVLLYTSPFG